MKTFFGVLAAIALVAETAVAQNSTDAGVQLPYGAPQVLQLSRAGVNDGTILTYIQNSGNTYNLNADQIIYLKQQGLSDTIINAMINQRMAVAAQNAATAAVSAPASAPVASVPASPPVVVVAQPVVTTAYVQSVPSSTVYVIPDTQRYNYYYGRPYYYPRYYGYYGGWYSAPSVSVSFGWDGGFHGYYGGGFHGHFGGGYHGHWR